MAAAAGGDLVSAAAGDFLQKFRLYETRSRFYMVGRNKGRTIWRVLKIDRLEPSELSIHEDPTVYSESECYDLLQRVHDGNRSTGGLKFVTKCYGITGFVKFLGPYYMLLITGRKKVGSICGHAVYTISKNELIMVQSPIVRNMAYSKNENRYKRLLCAVDLTKDFFFSYSYNIMRSLQKNICEGQTGQVLYETMFVWNEFLTRGIRNQLRNTAWTVALVYGFFKQSKVSISGKDFRLILIARRSRHFAGTRYLKRGVNEKGRVANDVETEQIAFEDTPEEIPAQITAVVQNRGSIPLFWSQEASPVNIRPDIVLHKDLDYKAMRLHFDNLVKRYGNPIIVLNLIKTREKKPRESLLRAEFATAIHYINKTLSEENRLRFLHWDLNKYSRRRGTNVLDLLAKVARNALELTDIFHCQINPNSSSQDALSVQITSDGSCDDNTRTDATASPGGGHMEDEAPSFDAHRDGTLQSEVIRDGNFFVKPLLFQKGVLRTNCIDCLDRTNVAQYAYGLAALQHQLHVLGAINGSDNDSDAPFAGNLMNLYEQMGDTLAVQYCGSAAHNKIFSERRGQWKAATQSQELIRTLQRYYSNAYMDAEKQDAINVFLGHFQPQQGKPALWELDSDQHHNIGRRGLALAGEYARSLIKRSLSDGNILSESNTPVSNCNIGEQNLVNSMLPPGLQQPEDAVEPSDSAPECDGCLLYARHFVTMPGKQLFPDRYSNFKRSGSDESHSSNFLDLDWISSSGNSCEEEIYERSSIIHSPVDNRSSENVISGVNSGSIGSLLDQELDSKASAETNAESSDAAAQASDQLSEFSERFINWVTNGDTLCY